MLNWIKHIPKNGISCWVSNRLGLQYSRKHLVKIVSYHKNEAEQYRFFDKEGNSWLSAEPSEL